MQQLLRVAPAERRWECCGASPGLGEPSEARGLGTAGPLCISSPTACVWEWAFSPKVVSNLCKTKTKHRMNVQIYFFMSRCSCVRVCIVGHTRVLWQMVMLSWTECHRGTDWLCVTPGRGMPAWPGTQQVHVRSSFLDGNIRGINCLGFFTSLLFSLFFLKTQWGADLPVCWAGVVLLPDPQAEMRPSRLSCGARRGSSPWVRPGASTESGLQPDLSHVPWKTCSPGKVIPAGICWFQ